MKRRHRWILIAVVLLAAGASIALFRNPAAKGVTLPPPSCNVLLITIDTLRPDHLSCYGSSNKTPNLDAIAGRGVLFQNAFTAVPLTFPAHTSILTGLYPVHTGIHNNGLEIFKQKELMISDAFHKQGYRTGAVVSSYVLDRKFGLAETFDSYQDRIERSPGITSNFEVERPADQTVDAAIATVEQSAGNKWFLWIHFYDPHTPYAPPSPLEGYDGEIQYVDQQIGRLFEYLKTHNLDRNLIVAVLGDHGESLGEHGEATHGYFVYNSTLKIPLILSYPGSPSGKKVDNAVASVDVTPTLLALAGIQDTQTRDGESLVPVLSGKPRLHEIYFESHYPELMGWNGLEGVLQSNWKLISTTRSELYDWQKDMDEKENLYSQKENISSRLKDLVQSLGKTAVAASKQTPDTETLEKLKSLGYVSTTSIAAKETNADPKDKIGLWSEFEKSLQLKNGGQNEESLGVLKALVEREPQNSFFRLTLASNLRESGKPEAALEQLTLLVKNDPSNADAYHELGIAEKEQHNYVEAVRAEQAAIALQPDRSDFHSVMGLILIETAQYEQAKSEFAQVLKIDPNNATVWNNLGNALRETNQLDQAIEAYRKAIQLSPHYAYPLNGLATVLIRQNQTADAIPYLEKAIDLDPKFVEVYLNLGIAYQTLGENDKAKTCYTVFLKIAPDWMEQERKNAQLLLSQLP